MIVKILWYAFAAYCGLSYLLVGYLLYKEHQEKEYEGTLLEKWLASIILFVISPLVMLHVFWQKFRGRNQPGVI